jgi:hypothetical protein
MILILFLVFLYDSSFKIFVLALLVLFPFWISYALGMAKYSIDNNIGNIENETWRAVIDEWKELLEEIKNKNVIGIILESSDVFQTIIKHVAAKISPNIIEDTFFWFVVFTFLQPTFFKHGKRFLLTGCIRNHKNPNNLNHKC